MITDIADLKPDPENPRRIKDKAAAGLKASMDKYGDLSGITWNKRTGELVCGHQRVVQLQELGGVWKDGGIHLPGKAEPFPVRIVDWTKTKQREANWLANNQFIAGEFYGDLKSQLLEIKASMGDDGFEEMNLDKLAESLKVDLTVAEPGDGGELGGDGDRDCWATPQDLFERLNNRFGFTVDVCALSWSAKCERYYTPEVNGLEQDWHRDADGGAVWCNPPFSNVAPWIEKAVEVSKQGSVVVVLLPATRTEQDWWQACVAGCVRCGATHLEHVVGDACQRYAPIGTFVPIEGRVAYVAPRGIDESSPSFPSCLVIFDQGPENG